MWIRSASLDHVDKGNCLGDGIAKTWEEPGSLDMLLDQSDFLILDYPSTSSCYKREATVLFESVNCEIHLFLQPSLCPT